VAIQIRPYTEEFSGPVAEFNRRVGPAHVPFRIPETPVPSWLPKVGGRNIYQEIFLAIEDGCVRGAYTFKHQQFSFWGRVLEVGACQMPISEGVVDKRYSLVGPKIVNDALRRQPLSYGLGLGSLDAAITRMLLAMGWSVRAVPFFFRVRNGFRFLRNIRYLKTTVLRRCVLATAAYSGFGWVGARIVWPLVAPVAEQPRSVCAEQVDEFSTWADDIWKTCKYWYSMVGVRDSDVLNILYPPGNPRFIRLKILNNGKPAGWAVLLDTVMSDSKYFGNMRVGSIADCLALPEDADKVISVASQVLEKRGVDLILSNQSHASWGRALSRAGFVEGPSNYLFVTSEPLTELLNDIDPASKGIHLNRGDGDGPIHL
jgi:hypothetical protein